MGAVCWRGSAAVDLLVTWHEAVEPAEHAGGILVEFAPVPAAPPAPPTELAPGPEQVMSDAAPELKTATVESSVEDKISSKPIEQPPPDVPQAPNPELAVELPTPKPKLQAMRQQEPRAPAPATSAPQAIPQRMAAIPAAPSQSQFTRGDSKAVAKWTTQIMELLDRNKRYPSDAHARREQGVALVFFSLDRHGQVIESRIVRSSGAAGLDQEAMALLRRAQPFPPWPAGDFVGDQVNLTVPIRFNLR